MKNNGKPLVSDSVTTPHPPSPPSKAELIELIKAKIREAYKGPTNWNGDTFDEVAFWFSKAEEIIGGIIDDARKVYSLDELLEIFKSEFEEWKIEDYDPSAIRPIARIQEVIDRWDKALYNRWVLKKSLKILQEYSAYPFNEEWDQDCIQKAIIRYPDVDIIQELEKKICWWKERCPDVLKANKSVRIQLLEWFAGEQKFQEKQKKKQESLGEG